MTRQRIDENNLWTCASPGSLLAVQAMAKFLNSAYVALFHILVLSECHAAGLSLLSRQDQIFIFFSNTVQLPRHII